MPLHRCPSSTWAVATERRPKTCRCRTLHSFSTRPSSGPQQLERRTQAIAVLCQEHPPTVTLLQRRCLTDPDLGSGIGRRPEPREGQGAPVLAALHPNAPISLVDVGS